LLLPVLSAAIIICAVAALVAVGLNGPARLEALRALGVRIALDDFGTGYSSLSYLQKFPFDRLKIDRAFVASLGTSGNSGAIIQSIVTLGHALGMKVPGGGCRDRRAAGASAARRLRRVAGPFVRDARAGRGDRPRVGPAGAPGEGAGGRVRTLTGAIPLAIYQRVSRRFWAREGARDDPEQPPRP
jgi:EAL domain